MTRSLLPAILLFSGLAALSPAPLRAQDAPAAGVKEDSAETINAYLHDKYPQEITRVIVSAQEVIIRGNLPEDRTALVLAEIPMERSLTTRDRVADLLNFRSIKGKSFEIRTPRFIEREGRRCDRLLSKWQLVRHGTEKTLYPLSHARYADQIACRAPDLPELKPASKKGLGGWSAGREPQGELGALGITSITVNVMVNDIVSLEDGPGRTPFEWQGRRYFALEERMKGYDATFQEAARNHVMVDAILLIASPAHNGGNGDATAKMLAHPAATPEGIFAMPNVTSPDGLALYGAALNVMAERWSRPDGSHGRVHHWILHNEVDAGWSWTNCGDRPAASFLDLYQRSLRLAHLIVRQYDPHSRVLISLTHHWTARADKHSYPSRELLELLESYSQCEGDFDWAIAYHPYPQSLFNPRTWEDKDARQDLNTPKITPRNLEVLNAWAEPRKRIVHLSENGFNSPDYGEISLRDQAAGMAYAWKKIEKLGAIQAWMYHNWIDNRGEGGLKIGLRKFPDEPGHPLEPKPIWQLYRALATPEEEQACAPYLPVTGLSSWNAILEPVSPPSGADK